MGFDTDKKIENRPQKRVTDMSFQELSQQLEHYENICRFNAAGASPRMQMNYSHIGRFAGMTPDEFKKTLSEARLKGKDIRVFSGAYTESGSVRIPLDDSGKYMEPALYKVINMQEERIRRIDFAKEMQVADFV